MTDALDTRLNMDEDREPTEADLNKVDAMDRELRTFIKSQGIERKFQ